MPRYVYVCEDGHEKEIEHSLEECDDPSYHVVCLAPSDRTPVWQACNKEMWRKPSFFHLALSPWDVLYDKIEREHRPRTQSKHAERERKAKHYGKIGQSYRG